MALKHLMRPELLDESQLRKVILFLIQTGLKSNPVPVQYNLVKIMRKTGTR